MTPIVRIEVLLGKELGLGDTIILCACGRDQYVYGHDKSKHMVFSRYCAIGLINKLNSAVYCEEREQK